MNKAIEISKLYYKYKINTDYILKGLDLTVNKGEVVIIVGLSGSGKSTLLKIISGIIPLIHREKIEGSIRLWGDEMQDLKVLDITKKLGMVFQDPDTQLFLPTVEDEIAFGPENLMVDRKEIGERIEKILKLVNMENFRYENPNNLSGGQKQLIAISAVLAMEPDIIIFDEVLSQVDNDKRNTIIDLIGKLKNVNKTIIWAEHNLENLHVADRVLELKNGKLTEYRGW